MTHRKLWAIVCATSLTAVGCGGSNDDNQNVPDASEAGRTDSSVDDAGGDMLGDDATLPSEGGKDGGRDAADAGSDSQADAKADAADAGDATTDAPGDDASDGGTEAASDDAGDAAAEAAGDDAGDDAGDAGAEAAGDDAAGDDASDGAAEAAADATTDLCSGVTCTTTDPCNPSACDSTTGQCTTSAATDGTACDDKNACTQTDTCKAGTCTGGNPVTCPTTDPCNPAACDTTSGQCTTSVAQDGTGCDDKNACTQTDTCKAGTCTGGNPVTCTADACHVAGTCDTNTGTCSSPTPGNDGASCSDTTACILNGTCNGGVCGGTACSTSLCGSSLKAFDGTQPSTWKLNGSAAYDGSTNTVVLVNGGQLNSAGTAIYQNAVVADSFDVTFDFHFDTTQGRADGLTFMMETDGNNAVGGPGASLGAAGLNGYAVELDIYDNTACGDNGNGDHAGIDTLATCGASGAPVQPTPVATSPNLYDNTLQDAGGGIGDIGDGQWRTAIVHVANGVMSVSITVGGNSFPVTNLQGVSLPNFAVGTTKYYLGFSAGSGSAAARQEIRNVSITFPSGVCL